METEESTVAWWRQRSLQWPGGDRGVYSDLVERRILSGLLPQDLPSSSAPDREKRRERNFLPN